MPFKTLSKEEFILKSEHHHGKRFDYTRSIYIDSRIPVEIICSIHGSFWQKPRIHMQGFGCKKCQADQHIARNSKNTNDFIVEIEKIFGDKLDYSNTTYKNCRTKVEIICPKHGSFKSFSRHLLVGSGCPSCGRRKTTDEFIREAKSVHGDRYDYSLVDYTTQDDPVEIICRVHGAFKQMPYSHIQGSNCHKCSKRISKLEAEWIQSIGGLTSQFRTPAGVSDGYDEKTNTIYEFYGDYWHGNPRFYGREQKTYYGVTFGDLYDRTMIREQKLRNLGYHVISIWECDYTIQTGRKVYKSQIKI